MKYMILKNQEFPMDFRCPSPPVLMQHCRIYSHTQTVFTFRGSERDPSHEIVLHGLLNGATLSTEVYDHDQMRLKSIYMCLPCSLVECLTINRFHAPSSGRPMRRAQLRKEMGLGNCLSVHA